MNEWMNEQKNHVYYPPSGRSVFTSFTLDAYLPPFLSWQERLHLSSGRRVAVGCTVLWRVGASVWGWLLRCWGKGQCVALYIISLTFVCIANYNIRTTTVLLRNQKCVVDIFLAFMNPPEIHKMIHHWSLPHATIIQPHPRAMFLL